MVKRISLQEALTSIKQSVASLPIHIPETPERTLEKTIIKAGISTCSKCQVHFDKLTEFKNHCKSPEHVLQLKKTETAPQLQEELQDSDNRMKVQRVPPYFELKHEMVTFRFFQEILNNGRAISEFPTLLRELEALVNSPVLFCLIRNGYVAIALVKVSNLEIVKSKCLKK